jgi:hypothetical protein
MRTQLRVLTASLHCCSVYHLSLSLCYTAVSPQVLVQAEIAALFAAVRSAEANTLNNGGVPYHLINAATRLRHYLEHHGMALSPARTAYVSAFAVELSPAALASQPEPAAAAARYEWLLSSLTSAYGRLISNERGGSSTPLRPEVLARESAGTPPAQAQFGGGASPRLPAQYSSGSGSREQAAGALQQPPRQQPLRLQRISEAEQDSEHEDHVVLHQRGPPLPASTQQRATWRPLRIGSPSTSSTAVDAVQAESAPRQLELVSHSLFVIDYKYCYCTVYVHCFCVVAL